MKRICVFTFLLIFFFVCPSVEARSLGQNATIIGIGCVGIALGVVTIYMLPKVATIWVVASIVSGVVACTYGIVDEAAKFKQDKYVKSDIEWEDDDFDIDAEISDFAKRQRASVQPPPKQSFWKNFKSLLWMILFFFF